MDAQKAPFAGRPTPLVLALSIAFAGTFLAMPNRALAQSARTAVASSYSIEKGPLEQTLLNIGRQAGRTIVFAPEVVRSLNASPVKGVFSAEDAVRAALQGTNLTLAVKADGTLSVSALAAGTTTPVEPVALKAITVVAERDQAETSFKVDRSSTSTRSDSDLMDVPASVTVVTAKVLESQQATTVEDAISQVAGVIYTKSPQGSPTFSIRGFTQTSALSNGLSNGAATSSNVFGVERIEVLKGPQAILSGSASLGGAVNLVTKKPQAEPFHELTLQYGSYGDKVIAGDLSGALSEDKKLTYRLIGSTEAQSKNYADYKGNHAEYIMPELRWKDDSTDVIVGYSTDNRRIAPPSYTFAYRGSVQETPTQLLGSESDGFGVQAQNYFYTLTQKLSPDVSFTSKMQRTDMNQSLRMYSPLGLAGPDTIYFAPAHNESETTTNAGDHYFEIKLKSGPISHKITTGVNHSDTDYSATEYDIDPSFVEPYGSATTFPRIQGTPYSVSKQSGKQMGGYLLDMMNWGDFNLLLGARRTKYQSESSLLYLGSGRSTRTPSSGIWETTPMVGIVYSVTPNISAYANYVDGFLPQLGYTMCGGTPTSPMRTKNKEAGMKFDFLDSKLSVTTAVFSLDQSNTMQYNSAGACYNLLAAQKTKGFELDVAGELYKGLNLLLNMTYTKLKDVSGKTVTFAARPTQRASVWATYDFQSEILRGWGTGLGVTGNNKSYLGTKYNTSTSDPVKLSGAARVDANVSYRQKGWSVVLGMKNIFNRDLYDFATTNSYVPLQQPRTATLTYKVNF